MIALPFDIHDGRITRRCEYTDLLIIVKLGLLFTVYSKERKWYFWRHELELEKLHFVYIDITTWYETRDTWFLTLAQHDSIGISHVVCSDLHKWKENTLLKIVLELI